MDTRVAARYARALFQVAQQHNMVAAVSDDLSAITQALQSDERFHAFLNDPTVDRGTKQEVLTKVFSDRATALTMQLLRLLVEKRRDNMVEPISEEFSRLRRESENVLFAEVTSAIPLSDEEKNALVRRLEVQTRKSVEATYSVDSKLIGGIRVAIGNHVLDGSVRGSLNRMRDRLLYDVLKQI